MNKIRKQKESERAWRKRMLTLSRAYAARMRRERKALEAQESEGEQRGYDGAGQLKDSPGKR